MIFHFYLLPLLLQLGIPLDEHTARQSDVRSNNAADLNARIYNVFLLLNQADCSFHNDRNLGGIPLVRNRGPE